MRRTPSRSARVLGALLSICAFCAVTATGVAPVGPPTNGPAHTDARWQALTGATAVTRPGRVVENATIVLRDGVIRSVQAGGAVPEGARRWDLTGLTVYAGFIEPYTEIELPEREPAGPTAHWRQNVTPERSALESEGLGKKERGALRSLGFAAAVIAPKDGLFRGSAALVSLAEPGDTVSASTPRVIDPAVYQAVAPQTGGWGGTPPTSLMGAIAIFRQVFLDAGWYAAAQAVEARRSSGIEPVETNAAFEALGANDASSTPVLFDCQTALNELRLAKVAREFDRRAILLGSGTEYQHLADVAGLGLPLVVPVNYPEAPDVSTIAAAEAVPLRDLMAWEQAPTNLRRLSQAGASVALTSHRLKKKKEFWPNLRSAVSTGLSPDEALAMLTVNAASVLGASDRLGTIDEGKLANLVVFDGDPFTDEDAECRAVWSAGARYEVKAPGDDRVDGTWAFAVGDAWSATLTVSKHGKAAKMEAEGETVKARDVGLAGDRLSMLIDGGSFGSEGVYRVTGIASGDAMAGNGVSPQGDPFAWTATRTPAEPDDADDDTDGDADSASDIPESLPVPFGAFGLLEPPADETVLVTGATVWTSGPDGIIEDGALLTRDGKIVYVGPASRTPRVRVDRTIDATGKHVTAGLMDAHSHSGISGGVNEGGQAVTAEVRIADVINPDSVAFYRELAGGVTTINQLHGSANPIGGQNSVIKLRWGVSDPEAFRVAGAIEGIKFALGENVKRSEGRYPDTRMGVEALIRDRFIAAREYAKEMAAYDALSKRQQARTVPPRRDLELDALAEILAGDRLIHCHSYRQDEILMLCRVADEFGFTIGTFQHVLEGYKVADAIKASARGGSCFSDWWAYKFEVFDAIPYNGALMHDVGVAVSFNSDSDELARRMNTEAAKAVRYGGVEPSEALKFVTLNPAYQFMIDDRIGSLEKGKDADFVIWSGSPLSSMSRCEATFVDGVERFSLEADAELRARDAAERVRLVQKILSEGARKPAKKDAGPGDPGPDPEARPEQRRLEAIGLEMLRAGLDPSGPSCGECGFMDRRGDHSITQHSAGGTR